MTPRDRLVDKIKKCLALANSGNEHEAAAALRQARKMMEAHGITDLDVLAAETEERKAKSGVTSRPAQWEATLASRIGDAFGCKVLFTGGVSARRGEWHFVGCGASPEICQYAFTTLLRQAKQARAEHIKTRLTRCKQATKTRRADLFCEGWVRTVTGKIDAFAGNERQSAAIAAYMAGHYPALASLEVRDRNDGRKLRNHEYGDYVAGGRSGRQAILNHAVSGKPANKALR